MYSHDDLRFSFIWMDFGQIDSILISLKDCTLLFTSKAQKPLHSDISFWSCSSPKVWVSKTTVHFLPGPERWMHKTTHSFGQLVFCLFNRGWSLFRNEPQALVGWLGERVWLNSPRAHAEYCLINWKNNNKKPILITRLDCARLIFQNITLEWVRIVLLKPW